MVGLSYFLNGKKEKLNYRITTIFKNDNLYKLITITIQSSCYSCKHILHVIIIDNNNNNNNNNDNKMPVIFIILLFQILSLLLSYHLYLYY